MKKRQILLTILTLLVLKGVALADDAMTFEFYCQQDNQDTQLDKKYSFISKIFTVKARYADHCYEANLKAYENKFENYLTREYDHLNLGNGIATCFCFETEQLASKAYRTKINNLRSTPDLKLYLIRTFPN